MLLRRTVLRIAQFGAATANRRLYCSSSDVAKNTLQGTSRGLVLGYYGASGSLELTSSAQRFNELCGGRFEQLIKLSGDRMKKGDCRLFYDLHKDYPAVSAVCIGAKNQPEELECIDVTKESVRQAAAVGVKCLKAAGATAIEVEDFGDPEVAGEGSTLAVYDYDQFKSKKTSHPQIAVQKSASPDVEHSWGTGVTMSLAQNFARELMEMPSNYLTPTKFVEIVCNKLSNDSKKIECTGRPLSWIRDMKMGAFLGVTKGSVEDPYLLEMKYSGGVEGAANIVLVGKGVTFDTGGISIKPSARMGLMRGDMGGAATVCATMMAITALQLPINVVGLTPLCENMPSGSAIKPGDVLTAMNGKTIEVDNTDAEGRLILADALCYAHQFNPKVIVDLATLTGAIDVALGSGAAAVFTNSDNLWRDLEQAGRTTGDRVWRMPLYSQYRKQIDSELADITNTSRQDQRSAGACTAASFLKEFVSVDQWAHLDIAGVMEGHGDTPYLTKGMSGRPTRTLIQYLRDVSKL